MRRSPPLAILAFFLAACAPQFQEIGPPIDKPALGPTAFHTPDGIDLPLKRWLPWDQPAKGAILALHGFNDYSNAFAASGHALARRGYIVYAFDQRGFGGAPQRGIWAGAAPMAEDANLALRLMKAEHPDLPLYLLGESMGGAIALVAATGDDPPPLAGLILVAPAIWGWETQSETNKNLLDFAYRVMPHVTVYPSAPRRASDNRRALIALARDPLVQRGARVDTAHGLVDLMSLAYQAGAKLKTPPWLILFGAREDILNDAAIADFLAHLPPHSEEEGRVALYPTGHHLLLRDLDAETVYNDIAAWLADPASPLPSGADRAPGVTP